MLFYGRAVALSKADASPVTEADHAANAVILASLSQHFPTDAILSEESKDSADRLGAQRVWIIDPLDGTKEFLAQNGEFSVMIGLVDGDEPVVGVVYMPESDVLYAASKGRGAWVTRGGQKSALYCSAGKSDALRMVGSRSHADPLLVQIQKTLGIVDVEPCGSVGVKCARIAEGRRDVYVHPVPYLKEWDTCAPEVVLREAGGEVFDCRGERLQYNKPDPRQPFGIVACGRGVLEPVLAATRSVFALPSD